MRETHTYVEREKAERLEETGLEATDRGLEGTNPHAVGELGAGEEKKKRKSLAVVNSSL